jgi:cobalt-zinc-cadmium efflux system outer membrane protein
VRQTVSFAYEKGGASLLDLLSAQRTDNEVRLATAQAAAETAKAAADLKAALNVGNDLPEK